MFKYFERNSDSDVVWSALQKFWALFAIALFVVTSGLWLPQTLFPQVALIELFNGIPSTIIYGAIAAVIIALFSILLGKFSYDTIPRSLKIRFLSWAIVVDAIVLLWLADQHRIQPWAVHLFVGALVFISCRPQRGVALLRILAISIYIYSALGKFDYQFMHSIGPQLLTGLSEFIGVDIKTWDSTLVSKLSLLLPAGELLIGIMLCHRRMRKLAIFGATLMHICLAVLFSPLGLNHEWGVVVWNVFFIVQNDMLFGTKLLAGVSKCRSKFKPATAVVEVEISGNTVDKPVKPEAQWIGQLILMAVLVLPALEPYEVVDHWPSWGLYSPRNSRVAVRVYLSAGTKTNEIEEFFQPQFGNAPFRVLDLSRWSLETLGVPIYPQQRYQLGVALAAAQKYNLGRAIEVDLLSMSDRLTGSRQRETLRGVEALKMACQRYRLNAVPASFLHAPVRE
ncbi:MAG: hypothetical protein HOB73_16020 [Planctomycetaceae bacterium]|nr:hypothetical protein [Planctomycetaceae bacterium]